MPRPDTGDHQLLPRRNIRLKVRDQSTGLRASDANTKVEEERRKSVKEFAWK